MTIVETQLVPFTIEHFEQWCSEIVLDNDERFVLEPFQREFVADLFAGRAIAWLVIPEGNGKTTLTAAIGLYYCEFKPGATVLAAAAAVEQARTIYSQAEGMVLSTPRLHEKVVSPVLVAKGKRTTDKPRFEALEGWMRINHADGGRFQIKPADAVTGDGVIPDLCIIDELHRHRNLNLYRTWAGKLRKRGGQMVVISTAGEPEGEFEKTRDEMRQNGDSIERRDCFTKAATERWVLHDWAVPEGGDVDDLDLVARANPLSHVTVETLAETKATPGITPQHWSRINCNVPMRGSFAAIQEREWHDAATAETIPADAEVWVGLDVAWQWDTTAFVPFWWRDVEYRLFGPAEILVPPRDGSSLDPNLVKATFASLQARYRISTVVMDTNLAQDLRAWFADELGLTVIDRAQTNKPQAEDYQRFMEALRHGWLRHSGDSGLRQHAFNAIARLLPDGGAKFGRISETRQGGNQDARVIDALVAASMVHSLAVEHHATTPVKHRSFSF